MPSSDEEGEIVTERVTNYYFVVGLNEIVSFSSLPLRWNNNGGQGSSKEEVEQAEPTFLRGLVEDGCRKIYKNVVAWKFELSYVHPEIYVLSNGQHGRWIMLQKPRKSYEKIIRGALVSVHCLHFMKKNLEEESLDALWTHIRRTYSAFEVPPSVDDLMDNRQWIQEAALRDKDIGKCKILPKFLHEVFEKRKSFHKEDKTMKKPKCGGYDDVDDDYYDDSDDALEDELFDQVCSLCDDGGDILCCEGWCVRSFHPTKKSGADSFCESLGYSQEQVDALQTFLCKNCQYQKHQCFICGRLGNSDKSFRAEVFPCVSATCGHFYHPQCISKLFFPGDENKAQEFQKQIENGESFTCPAHKCYVCKQGEDKNVKEMQFAVCRRCPKAYHRKCLPRSISLQGNLEKYIPQRAWEGLLTNRILIYCMDHKIFSKIGTPRRDHLVFPEIHVKRKRHSSEDQPEKTNVLSARRSKALGILTEDKLELLKEATVDFRRGDSINKIEKSLARKVPKGPIMGVQKNVATSDWRKTKRPFRAVEPHSSCKSGPSVSKPTTRNISENEPSVGAWTFRTKEMEKRIQRLIKECNSSINVEEFLDEQRNKYPHARPTLFRVDRIITMGKVEHSVQAIEAALKKLQEGGTIEDAKAVCEPAILLQIIRWKRKLGVYLAPFIQGMRYTSFGRHFTKVDKLEQVVDRLRQYVEDGDTIIDFCCGANDFSILMKKDLERMGRKCYFKNYDIMASKNDFNFERRDWMSVSPGELPDGSKLIMGLNPPFGVQSARANQFIDKALTFRPKLLILIVPIGTKRLDEKRIPYDLIWEDCQIFSGKSFYLPGSIDVYGEQMEQWNIDPPHLYLWSRPDWTSKHKKIAAEHGHMSVVAPRASIVDELNPRLI